MAAARRGRRRRLSRSGEFERVYRDGSSHANRFLVAYAFARETDEPGREARLGVSVGRKVGNAVERNGVKRALRDAFWRLADRLPEGHDYVLLARPPVAELLEREGPDGVRRVVRETLTKAARAEDV